MSAGRHRIETTLVPGVTSAESFDRQPGPFEYAISGNRFFCVTGAAGIKAAVIPKPGAQAKPIQLNQGDKNATHHCSRRSWCVLAFRNIFCHCCCNIEDSSLFSKRPISRRANITTSRKGASWSSCRKNSLVTRFMRLRSTASFTFFFAITRPRRCVLL